LSHLHSCLAELYLDWWIIFCLPFHFVHSRNWFEKKTEKICETKAEWVLTEPVYLTKGLKRDHTLCCTIFGLRYEDRGRSFLLRSLFILLQLLLWLILLLLQTLTKSFLKFIFRGLTSLSNRVFPHNYYPLFATSEGQFGRRTRLLHCYQLDTSSSITLILKCSFGVARSDWNESNALKT
jgi:hypothetical protein